jgi:hypothetical protein
VAYGHLENSAFGMISNDSGLTKTSNKKIGPVGNSILGLEDDKGKYLNLIINYQLT